RWLEQGFVIAALANGSPCGACRQIANEFSHENTIVLIDDLRDGVLFRIRDLLPVGFYFGRSENAGRAAQNVGMLEARAATAKSPAELAGIAASIAENSCDGIGFKRNGAVIVAPDGQAVCGASAVNSSIGLSINALRATVSRATQKGLAKKFGRTMIAKAAISFIDQPESVDRDFAHALPIDILREFGNDQTEIIIRNANGKIAVTSLGAVLGPVRGLSPHAACNHS
ncbi:MAG TPA: hypothetical protein VIF12_01905, partial [Micavibrio sp.]